jgi:hypothetical protein
MSNRATIHQPTDGNPRGSWLRRTLSCSAVAFTVATVAALSVVGAAAPAHADGQYNRVTLSGSIFIHDDDLIWDDNGTHLFSSSVRVGPTAFSKSYRTWDCVGGEVYGTLLVIVEDQNNGWVKIRARGRLYEQETCPNSDLDGDSGEKVLWVPPNSSRSLQFRVDNGEPSDGGYNVYTLRVQNITPVP